MAETQGEGARPTGIELEEIMNATVPLLRGDSLERVQSDPNED